MKTKAISLLTLALLSTQTAQASEFKPSSGVEFSNPQKLKNLMTLDEKAKLTEAELKEIQAIDVYTDIDNKNSIYYVQPVRVTKWSETRYTTNMMIHERIHTILFSMIDAKIATIAPAATALISDAAGGTMVRDELVANDASIGTIDQAKRDATVSAIKLMQALLPEPYNLLPVASFEDALLLANDVINKVPSVRAQMSIGWGYSDARSKAFTKAQGVLAEKKFFALPVKSAYTLKSNRGETPAISSSNEEQKAAAAENMKRRKFQSKMYAEIEGIKVSNVGTVVGLDLFNPLTMGWNLVPSDPKAGAGILPIEGDFVTSFPMSVDFKGRVDCSFGGAIKRKKFFSVQQMPNTILMVEASEDKLDETTGGIVDCALYDQDNKLLSSDGKVPVGLVPKELIKSEADRENIARALNAQIEGKINQFNMETSALWRAGTDLRDEVLRQAQNMANGYINLPVPMESKIRLKWETTQECRKLPRQGACLRHGWKKGHGIKSLGDKWICKEHETLYDQDCKDVQHLVRETYQQPVKVRGFTQDVDFEKTFDVKKSYEITGSASTWFDVFAANDACLKRKSHPNGAEFTSCDGIDQQDLSNQAIDRSVDEPTIPEENPAASSDVVFF